MILERLALNNFCLYSGEQMFDLSPVRRRGKHAPIVLVGGINGGGKTTLLDAVQLALYGKRASCSKRAAKPYDEFLAESIHHGADHAGIRLAFRYVSEGKEQLYEIARSWAPNGKGRIRERVRVARGADRDSLETDGWLSENWNQLVEDLIPLGIAQLCFFDAEKIRFLAEDESSSRAMGEAIKSLLSLDLAERLVADASVLEARIAGRVRKSPDLQELEGLELELAETQSEIERHVQELGGLENPRQAARNQLKDTEERFAKVGGRHWERREARQRQLGELEQELRETDQRLVALSATELPLALVPELLRQVADQNHRERQSAEAQTVSRLLAKRDKRLVAGLKKKRVSVKAIEFVETFLEADRTERGTQAAVPCRLQLSDGATRMLDHLLERGLAERTATAAELLKRYGQGQQRLEDVQRALAATPDEDAVREVAERLGQTSAELATLDQQARQLEKRLAGARARRDEIQKKLDRLRRKVIDEQLKTEEDRRLAHLLGKTRETMRAFLKQATARKIDRLSRHITESFRYLLRKTTLVERVLIDPHDFTITLVDDTGRPIPKQRLSEGEKQIFAVSVLWGLSRTSARPLPAIVDTPMARLDAKHRDQLVERYFPHASHQVIVLSTDTEVECRYFHQLQPHIARAYHLNYDEQHKRTVAEEGYFWDQP